MSYFSSWFIQIVTFKYLVNFKGVLSRLSKSIATVIKDSSSQYTSITNTLLDLAAPGLQEWQIQVCNNNYYGML